MSAHPAPRALPAHQPVLSDGDLDLRPWRPDDAPAVLVACQDPALQPWLPVPVPYLPEHAEGFVGEFARGQWASGTGAPIAAVDHRTGDLLGSIGLKDVDGAAGSAEIGYWVAPAARGRSVARRGVRLLADWAFEQIGLQRLVFLVEPANAASVAVVTHIGATLEDVVPAVLVIHGTPRDTARYVLASPGSTA